MKEMSGRRGRTHTRSRVPSQEKKSQVELNITVSAGRGTSFLRCSAVFRLLRMELYDPWVLSAFVLDHIPCPMQSTHQPREPNVEDSQSVKWREGLWEETKGEALFQSRKGHGEASLDLHISLNTYVQGIWYFWNGRYCFSPAVQF